MPEGKPNERWEDKIARLPANVVRTVGAAFLVYLPIIFGWQVITWLDVGVWVDLPGLLAFANHALLQPAADADATTRKIFAVMHFIPEFQWPWLESPDRWVGVHKIVFWLLKNVHIGVFSAVVGVLCLWLSASITPSESGQAPDGPT